ncbi:MAG: FGGY family carbohydrate kinase [Bacteroidota bacterium]
MLLLGYDIGSSSVKASIVDGADGSLQASAFFPKQEMPMIAHQAGWAEQPPMDWWQALKDATAAVIQEVDAQSIGAIGISYQMHGLVLVDKKLEVLRPSIIWCDSRAVPFGEAAFEAMGADFCLQHLLNSPGNFTAGKLAWVKEHEPALFATIHKLMLPGDYIALKLTGEARTTISGLSEGIFWDFQRNAVSQELMDYFGFSMDLIPDITPTFGDQGHISAAAAEELGLPAGIPVAYRAGDQPNNALSLNVLEPGEIAATAGTSGVVYGVSEQVRFDPQSRVNSFAHVNHTTEQNRLGVLLCVNGTGILNSWLKHNVGSDQLDYVEMNALAENVPIGSDGLNVLPFGNGAERPLANRNLGAQVNNLNFNRHSQGHLLRAAQEGIVFALHYGMEIMGKMGIQPKVIRAGKANMFLSPIFRDTLAGISGAPIELYNTDGAQGAARAAGFGAGYYSSLTEAFAGLRKLAEVEPDLRQKAAYEEAYGNWQTALEKALQ